MKIKIKNSYYNIEKIFNNKNELINDIENYHYDNENYYLFNKKMTINELLELFYSNYKILKGENNE